MFVTHSKSSIVSFFISFRLQSEHDAVDKRYFCTEKREISK